MARVPITSYLLDYMLTVLTLTTNGGVHLQCIFLIDIILQFVFDKYENTKAMFLQIVIGKTSNIIRPFMIR